MYTSGRFFTLYRKGLHTMSHDGPTETFKMRINELRKVKKRRNPEKNQIFVEVPESKSFLDTATLPLILAAAGIALFAKVLMMLDESKAQEMIERKIENAPAGQGKVRMLTREEWEEVREMRPRTPFESKLARPNARIRTGESIQKEDLKNWSVDIITDAFARAEESVRFRSSK